jgi:hypothetical protein
MPCLTSHFPRRSDERHDDVGQPIAGQDRSEPLALPRVSCERKAMMMSADSIDHLPTAAEIASDSLEGWYSIKHFHGKTLAEAEEIFAAGCRDYIPLTYTDDLMWMEPVGFRFYIRAAVNVALSERANGESDFINGLASTISFWHEQHPGELVSCAPLLADFCCTVVQQFDRYDADPEIYTGLREQYQQLADIFTRLSNAPGKS